MEQILSVCGLTCNGLENPLGTACENLCFHWKIKGEAHNVRQRQFRLQIGADEYFRTERLIADITETDERQHYYLQETLTEKTKYFWRVSLCLNYDG